MSQHKRDFGSFHTSNVQELLALPEDQYRAPPLPFDLASFSEYRDKIPEFGKKTKERHFYLEPGVTFLNHGAFGSVLKQALEDAQKWQIYIEKQPLRFFDREVFPHLVHVNRKLAKFVGCSPSDIVLLPNVTTGLNAVMRSMDLKKGDVVYRLNIEYGATKKISSQISKENEAIIQEEHLSLPIDCTQQVIDLVSQTLVPGTRLAVFDHIPSNTPFIMPIKKLIELCHNRNVKVLVDGAHALGSVHLDLASLHADYYVTNAHKWFCAPKGVALLYVAPEVQKDVHPLVISHGHGSGFNSEFMWSGLRDYSPFLSLLTVIDFWEMVGMQNIHKYIYDLAHKAAKLLETEWGTRTVAPLSECSSMVLVQLPVKIYQHIEDVTYSDAENIQNTLFSEYNIEVPIKAVQGVLYVRISAHIYNELYEYQRLADAVKSLIV